MQDKPTFVTKENAITAYKGFDNNLTCRGFVYKVGETFSHQGNVMVCEGGFHACFDPKDVFTFYPPAGSEFAVVKLWGNLSWGDNKVAAEHIEVVHTLSLLEFVGILCEDAAASATGDQGAASATGDQGAASATGDQGAASATGYQGAASATGDQGAASATGYQGAASATGYQGAASATGDRGAASATGDRGAASATGYQGAASATGDQGAASATGDRGAASATGYQGKVMGTNGNALFLTERDDDHNIINVWAGVVGVNGVQENVWYTLQDGKLTVVED